MDSITFRRPLKITASGETVVIGTQSWTTKNLNVSTYRDGTIIPQVQNVISWAALKTGAWCYYENKTVNGTIYGKLYNWYAVAGIHDNDPNTPNKTLAPAGYHIPTAEEWMTLTTFLGGENLARSKMKATTLWAPKAGITNTNTSGFTGLPGGYCSDGAVFNDLGYTGVWWTATEDDKDYAWGGILSYDDGYEIAGTSIKLYGLSVRCIVGEPVVVLQTPTLSTSTATAIGTTTAITGGNISNDGNAAVTARGIVYSESANPTIDTNAKTNEGSGTGSFISNLKGLSVNTTYYFKAYATNSVGTSYGDEMTFTTTQIVNADGTVTIGKQTWATKNLDLATYRDGTVIPQVTDPKVWENLKTGAWCYYVNKTTNGTIYGKLYNWYAVAGIHDNDPNTPNKQLAPAGYHIPTESEWSTLINFLGGIGVAGDKMKATTLWETHSGITNTNSSGFTGLPGSYRNYDGDFGGSIGFDGAWWSNTIATYGAYVFYLASRYSYALTADNYKVSGFSVRCIKN